MRRWSVRGLHHARRRSGGTDLHTAGWRGCGQTVLTIEGLGTPENPHPIQAVWGEQSVAQCGYCHSGQVMAAAALLAENPSPTEQDVDTAMAGNICRCGCYPRIKAAVLTAAERIASAEDVQGASSLKKVLS